MKPGRHVQAPATASLASGFLAQREMRRYIANADATLPDRLRAIADHAERVSLVLVPAMLASLELLQLSRAGHEAGIDAIPETSAQALFDLLSRLMGDTDELHLRAEGHLLELGQPLGPPGRQVS